MAIKILINAVDPEEVRIAKVTGTQLDEFHIETRAREITQGNLYKGTITRVEPSLHAVFVDYGAEKNGFLQKQDIHSDYYLDISPGDRSIKNLLRPGLELIVQVAKDPISTKGALLTTFISVVGRYLILMPGSQNIGISRKIETEEERNRLREIVKSLSLPEDFGLIVRTAGNGCTKTQLKNDFTNLMRLWREIKKKALDESAPALIYKEKKLAVRVIRDYLTTDVSEILIDDGDVYNEIKELIQIIAPKQTKIVRRHRTPKPIFTKFQLERQIASIFENRVPLKSGGFIIIQPTEALVSIDVNSGKSIQGKSIKETAFNTNVEAAEEIARQLKLRDLGGLIVIDFIDMLDAKHRAHLEKTMKLHLKTDKAKTKVGRISKFGLMELSRQRIRPSIEFGSYVTCCNCQGKGLVPSIEVQGIQILRKLRLETLKDEKGIVKGIVPEDVAQYLLNKKRSEILALEQRRGVSIVIESASDLLPGQWNIVKE